MTSLAAVLDAVHRHGDLFYLIIFAWTFLEGETCVLVSGMAARAGALDVRLLVAVAWAGAFLGDQIYFLVGRRWGGRVVDAFPRIKPAVIRATGFLERYQIPFIMGFRFVYGVRNISSFAIGLSNIPWRRFVVLNFLSAGVWACAFGFGGYLAEGVLSELLSSGALSELLSSGALSVAFLALVAAIGLFLWTRRAPPVVASATDE